MARGHQATPGREDASTVLGDVNRGLLLLLRKCEPQLDVIMWSTRPQNRKAYLRAGSLWLTDGLVFAGLWLRRDASTCETELCSASRGPAHVAPHGHMDPVQPCVAVQVCSSSRFQCRAGLPWFAQYHLHSRPVAGALSRF